MSTHLLSLQITLVVLLTCRSLDWIVEIHISCHECCNGRTHTISNVTPYHIIYCVHNNDSNCEKNVVGIVCNITILSVS